MPDIPRPALFQARRPRLPAMGRLAIRLTNKAPQHLGSAPLTASARKTACRLSIPDQHPLGLSMWGIPGRKTWTREASILLRSD